MSRTAIVGATLIDGTGRSPIEGSVVVVEDGRIDSVISGSNTAIPDHTDIIDARGKYIIPGLMDANVHLFQSITPDLLIEYAGRYHEFVIDAAQTTLKSGVTTVFDTWGPLEPLATVRDSINRGETTGSRIFLAGNIIGLNGPLSSDFFSAGNALGADTVERINSQWEQGVGAELLWLPPDEVRHRVRDYIERSGVDFVKYAANGHSNPQFIAFSELTQQAIVDTAHRAGLRVQAHTETPEGLRMEIEAGADLLQHGDQTGMVPIPETTLKVILERELPVAAMVWTERFVNWVKENGAEVPRKRTLTKDKNDRRLIEAGARLLLTSDGYICSPRLMNHPLLSYVMKDAPDFPNRLGDCHFLWLEAVIERGMAPMEALLSATRYVAEAYGQADQIGTVEPGKRADLVVLEADPLTNVRNYRRIAKVMKDGVLVNRDNLPVGP